MLEEAPGRMQRVGKSLKSHFGIYLDSLEEIIGIMPKSKEVSNLMNRIITGLSHSHSMSVAQSASFFQQMQDMQSKSLYQLNLLQTQFQEFKTKNNIDLYFKKYLSDETRKQTLNLVDELMNDNEDWYDALKDYKESLDKLTYSETEARLQNFYDDLIMAQKGHLAIFREQTEDDEKELQRKQKNEKPLPAQIFNQEMEKVLGVNYVTGIQETGKRVVQQMLNKFVKPTATAEVQTESI